MPGLRLAPDEHALHHQEGGTVLAQEGMQAMATVATRLGASLISPERVVSLEPCGDGVRLTTTGRRIDAGVAVMATGPWANELLTPLGLGLPLAPAVAQVTYFDIPSLVARPGLAEWSVDADGRGVYGHPVPGVGYKFAFDAAGSQPWSPTTGEWPPDPREQQQLVSWVERRFPAVAATVVESQRHPWTMTPDSDFVIDRDGPVVVACGCSGHAFKFGPALGELVADIAQEIPRPEQPLFSMRRAGLAAPAPPATAPITR